MRILGQKILFNLKICNDRRRYERVPTRHALNLEYSKLEDQQHGSGIAKNISLGGTLFAADSMLPIGTPFDLTLHFYPGFATAGSIQARGRVVRCFQTSRQNHFRIACVFDRIEDRVFEKLKSLIEQLKEKLR